MSKQCTDGEWPCEMSTYLVSLECENTQLKDSLKSLFDKALSVSTRAEIKNILDEYPDFIRERESTQEIKYPLSKIKEAFWKQYHKSGATWFDYLSDEKTNEDSTMSEWFKFLEELEK